MSGLQIPLIVALVLPALAVALWPLRRGAGTDSPTAPERPSDDRRLELEEEKVALYRALHELDFDHDAGHLSDADYEGLHERYETAAAELLTGLDALGPAPAPPGAGHAGPDARSHRLTDAAARGGGGGCAAAARVRGDHRHEREPLDRARRDDPARGAPARPGPGASPVGPPTVRLEPGKPIPPGMLTGMLQAARQSLFDGNYSQAMAAYQAVLKRDAKNVDALTHMGLIVAIGGHADVALETIDKALAIDPTYPPAYLYRGQVLFEQKQDYADAVKSWQQFLALVPTGEDHDRVAQLVESAKSKQQPR